MALAGDSAKRYDIPGEPGQWVELFDLGFLDLNAATAESAREGRMAAREWGPAYPVLLDRADKQSERSKTKRTKVDPFATHNTLVLLDRGLHAWSYTSVHLPARSENREQQAERLNVIGKLDPKTSEWIARTLLENANIDNARGLDSDDNNDVIDIDGRPRDDEEENPTLLISSSRWTV